MKFTRDRNAGRHDRNGGVLARGRNTALLIRDMQRDAGEGPAKSLGGGTLPAIHSHDRRGRIESSKARRHCSSLATHSGYENMLAGEIRESGRCFRQGRFPVFQTARGD